jgi:hypothetical protein
MMDVQAQKTETAQMDGAEYGKDSRTESTEILEIMSDGDSIGDDSGSVQSSVMVFGDESGNKTCDTGGYGERKQARLVPLAINTNMNLKQAETDPVVAVLPSRSECEEKSESSEEEESRDWISKMISLEFFQPCDVHHGCRKNECNFFCLERDAQHQGNGFQALCKYCLDDPGFNGICFQIRRYMYQNVVHVEDLGKYYDVGGIQAYCINGKRAVLLSPKSPPTNTSAVPAFDHVCRSCRVPLRPDCSFCSLHCKLWNETGKEPRTPFPAVKRKRALTFSVDESDATVLRRNNFEPKDRSKSRSGRRDFSQAHLSNNVRIRRNRRKSRKPVRSPEF